MSSTGSPHSGRRSWRSNGLGLPTTSSRSEATRCRPCRWCHAYGANGEWRSRYARSSSVRRFPAWRNGSRTCSGWRAHETASQRVPSGKRACCDCCETARAASRSRRAIERRRRSAAIRRTARCRRRRTAGRHQSAEGRAHRLPARARARRGHCPRAAGRPDAGQLRATADVVPSSDRPVRTGLQPERRAPSSWLARRSRTRTGSRYRAPAARDPQDDVSSGGRRAGAARAAPIDVPLDVVDLSSLEEATRLGEFEDFKTEWTRQTFDLGSGPLFRTRLVRLAASDHVLLLSFHHIVCDGWSLGIFTRELTAAYASATTGANLDLPELPVQYADFAAWQRSVADGPELERHLDYWRRKVAPPLPVLELPTDRPRASVRTAAGAVRPFHVSDATARKLEVLAQSQDATLFIVLLAGFKALLFQYTGQRDIVVGSGFAGRERPEVEPLIGFFVNGLALRTLLRPEMTVAELVRDLRQPCLEAFEHQDVPVEKLVEELRPSRDAGPNPLYQVMFAMQPAATVRCELPSLDISAVALPVATSRCDLTVSMTAGGRGLAGLVEYSSDLFDAETVDRLAAHYVRLLDQLVDNPTQTVEELSLADSTEQAALGGWACGAATPSPAGTVPQSISRRAAANPEAIAVWSGGARLSYGELETRANRL